MSKQRRTFNAEDCYSIVQESLRDGHADVSRKYNLSPSLLRRWKQKYLDSGKMAFAIHMCALILNYVP
ncbi:transposase [Telluribacter sp. SYSU D00476]|uniref:transposase n=1 Tax=Telluribacter sp. SYSU D00476 TaxID=2811430 RepID=UPI001FF45F6A|nr:transposase [Telluribacter sp. SYSU D00476]